ncbi:MAG: alpha/beta fold hydrolase [Halanaeroarchaeum sp.]
MEQVRHHDRTTTYHLEDRTDGGPSIVFAHGSGGTHAVWKAQLARLSDRYRIVALDLSGHGDSTDFAAEEWPAAREGYVEDLLAVANAESADVLVGNSLGGAVVQQALLDADPRARAAVLVGSGAKLTVLEDLRDLLANDFERAVEFLHGDDMLFHDPDEELEALAREDMLAVGRRVTERDFLASHTFDERDRIERIEVPTLAITGEHDRLTPPAYHEYLAEHVPQGEWQTLPDAAHLSMLEAPAAFNDALAGFIRRALSDQ